MSYLEYGGRKICAATVARVPIRHRDSQRVRLHKDHGIDSNDLSRRRLLRAQDGSRSVRFGGYCALATVSSCTRRMKGLAARGVSWSLAKFAFVFSAVLLLNGDVVAADGVSGRVERIAKAAEGLR